MSLPNRISLFAAAVFMILLAEVFVAGRASRATENCIREPNAAAPEGSHWYYHMDRATQQKCWHLRSEGIKKRPRTQQATTAVPPPASPEPVVQPIAQTAAASVATTAGEAKPAEDDLTVPMSSIETSGLGRPNQSTLAEAPMPNRLVDRQSAPETRDEPRAMRPITTPSDMTTDERASTFTVPYLAAIIAAVLGLVVIMGRITFRLSAVRRFSRAEPRDRFGRGSRLDRLDTEAPSKFSKAAAAAHHTDILRTTAKSIMPQVCDSAGEIETSVRQLLQELLRRQNQRQPTRRVPRQAAERLPRAAMPNETYERI
jgi:hypothetical protein